MSDYPGSKLPGVMGAHADPHPPDRLRTGRRRSVVLLALLALATVAFTFFPQPGASAQEGDDPADDAATDDVGDGEVDEDELADQGLAGQLTAGDDREPVPGAVITVTDEAGNEVAVVETDDEGRWEVLGLELGTYTALLDEDTLPGGITVTEGRSAAVDRPVSREGQTARVAIPLTDEEGTERGGRDFSGRASQAVVNGLKFGLIIGMASIGLSLIFGTTGLINFAHGELVTLGAILAVFLNTAGVHVAGIHPLEPLPLVGAVLLSVVLIGLFGGALELGIFRPMRARSTGQFQLLVITIGISLALREALLIWFGPRPRNFRIPLQQTVDVGPVAITPRDMTVMALSLAALLLVGLMLQFTRIGKAMRAVADNQDLAESSGIDVKKIILLVWVMGAGLAALGGSFFGIVTTVDRLMGFELLLLMFAAVILGGLGTAFGAVAGGLLVGLVTEVSTLWAPTEIKYVWALAALVLVLLLRPQGIFGVRERVG
jgi:neutral amino acid transport system permease protein